MNSESLNHPSQWTPVPGFESFYEINIFGTIRCLRKRAKTAKLNGQPQLQYLTTKINNSGYRQVRLSRDGKTYTCSVHRLLALAFLPPPTGGNEVNHINGIKTDNRIENLEWCNHSYNVSHAYKKRLRRRMGTVPVQDFATGAIYPSVKEASKATGIKYPTLKNFLNGNRLNPTLLRPLKRSL